MLRTVEVTCKWKAAVPSPMCFETEVDKALEIAL